ncbi:MAG: ABC transporter ATP-binding protein [Gammaproteobacteria bacterium]|nr:ABC transporter ATP-binding protein [Gammaproteobacteria bacterium]
MRALSNVSFDVMPGRALALIGESGSGKSTLGSALTRLLPRTAEITSGSITFNGKEGRVQLLDLSSEELRRFRWRDCAVVSQMAMNAFNPVMTIQDHFEDTAAAHGLRDKAKIHDKAYELMETVHLDAKRVLPSYPHQLSGGMRQRVLIALSLLLSPELVILDEPTTALDALSQRAIIKLLRRLRQQLGLTMIFISHDLSLAAELADDVATMYAGQIVEYTDVFSLFDKPKHPYSVGLIGAIPDLSADGASLVSIPGSPPDLVSLPSGCRFHPRCPLSDDKCERELPLLVETEPGQKVACFHWKDAQTLKGSDAFEGRNS